MPLIGRTKLIAFVVLAGCMPALSLRAQACLPFGPGEHLTYRVRAAFMGAKGETRMWVAGPDTVRGRIAYRLRSDASVSVGFLKGGDHTSSWIDPVTFAALRYTQQERSIFGRSTDSVEIFPEERRWERSENRRGETASDAPLDVLSYIYLLRTLRFGVDSTWTFNRHVDVARNPTLVRVIGLDSITTPAGSFSVWSVEMRVRDKEHYEQEGVIKLLFSTDDRRLPVRIQSVMPRIGTTVMTLAAVVPPTAGACTPAISATARR